MEDTKLEGGYSSLPEQREIEKREMEGSRVLDLAPQVPKWGSGQHSPSGRAGPQGQACQRQGGRERDRASIYSDGFFQSCGEQNRETESGFVLALLPTVRKQDNKETPWGIVDPLCHPPLIEPKGTAPPWDMSENMHPVTTRSTSPTQKGKETELYAGLFGLLTEDMAVMAVKGFLIDDCVPGKVYSPPFLSKQSQMPAAQVHQMQEIAHLRVHIEKIPVSLMGSINCVWAVACLLTNYQCGPLVKAWAKEQ
ncbi:unnamed protein product [Coregonus sp. 'balchen']|nr:unnamed protein product [Coregonus sp. 'balchen']